LGLPTRITAKCGFQSLGPRKSGADLPAENPKILERLLEGLRWKRACANLRACLHHKKHQPSFSSRSARRPRPSAFRSAPLKTSSAGKNSRPEKSGGELLYRSYPSNLLHVEIMQARSTAMAPAEVRDIVALRRELAHAERVLRDNADREARRLAQAEHVAWREAQGTCFACDSIRQNVNRRLEAICAGGRERFLGERVLAQMALRDADRADAASQLSVSPSCATVSAICGAAPSVRPSCARRSNAAESTPVGAEADISRRLYDDRTTRPVRRV